MSADVAIVERSQDGPARADKPTQQQADAHQRRCPGFDRATYRERNRVERLINRLKQFRALATRYDKLAEVYHALLTIAFILLWL